TELIAQQGRRRKPPPLNSGHVTRSEGEQLVGSTARACAYVPANPGPNPRDPPTGEGPTRPHTIACACARARGRGIARPPGRRPPDGGPAARDPVAGEPVPQS